MTKNDLIILLQSLNIAVNEGVSSKDNINIYPRIVFWDYLWEYQTASSGGYADVQTYQISFFSKTPRHQKILELREKLKRMNLFPVISHEYVEEDRIFHSFLSLDIYDG